MDSVRVAFIWLLLAALMAVLFANRSLLDALIDAINRFKGGPPSPMHPSPANDARLLCRRKPGK